MDSAQNDETSAAKRVAALLEEYGDREACAAQLLCDRHEPDAVAYRIVATDLSSADLTYSALREESERLASALSALGFGVGDRIATLMGKSRAYLVTVMAIWRLGAVHVPLFTAFAPPAVAQRLIASRCRLVISDAAQQAKLVAGDMTHGDQPWSVITTGIPDTGMLAWDEVLARGSVGFRAAAVGGDGPIIQLYTSGTTGNPKGVVVPLRGIASFQCYAEFGLDLRRSDVFWNAADPGWAYGLYCGVIAGLATGATSVMLEAGFSPETTLATLARYSVTNFAAAPTVFRSLRASGAVLPAKLALRCISSAGEPLTPEVNEWASAALGVPVRDHYGQTEAGMIINNHHHPALRRPLKPGSMGHAMPGWSAAVLRMQTDEQADVGEQGRLAVDLTQSPLAWFSGYIDGARKSAEKFSADGRWYFTGDTACIDDEGYFSFTAREDDVIIMAGYRIGPIEIERVLSAHPAVSEGAVVAVPDEVRGESLEAVVVLRPGVSASDALTAELQARVKKEYAAHAYPRRVHYVDGLPKTPSGKVQRFLLRKQLREQR
jgi:acetyl-CoA synthetase